MSIIRYISSLLSILFITILFFSEPLRAELPGDFYAKAWSQWTGDIEIKVLSGNVVIRDVRHKFPNPFSPGYYTQFTVRIDKGNDGSIDVEEHFENLQTYDGANYGGIFEGQAFYCMGAEYFDEDEQKWVFPIDGDFKVYAATTANSPNDNNGFWAISANEIEFQVDGIGTIEIKVPYSLTYDLKTTKLDSVTASAQASIGLWSYHDSEVQHKEEKSKKMLWQVVVIPPLHQAY